MRAYMRDKKVANKPSAYDDFIELCTHFGFVACGQKHQALANLQIRDWLLPEGTIQKTKLYKQLEKFKGTEWECGTTPEEWRAIVVLNAFMPAALHIVQNVPLDRESNVRRSFAVFHYRLLPDTAGRALIAEEFFNPINQSKDMWLYARMYFLWSTYFDGKQDPLLTDLLRVCMAVYVAAWVSDDLAQKIYAYAIHVFKFTPIGSMTFSKAVLHTVSDVLDTAGDADFNPNNLRGATLAQLAVKGIRYPSYKRMANFAYWSLKETFDYGWNLKEAVDDETKLYKDVLNNPRAYGTHDKTDMRKVCDQCRYGFDMDVSFVNGTMAAFERVSRPEESTTTDKERQITQEYEEKFKTMNSRLSERTAAHQETKSSLEKAEKRIKELEVEVAEKNKQLADSDVNRYKKRISALEQANSDLSAKLTGAQSRIETLESREGNELLLTERIKQLESDCEFYQKMISVEEETEEVDDKELTSEEIEQLKGIRAHLIFPALKSLAKLPSLLPACRITYNGADHRASMDVPKNMEMYVFCTKIAGHSDWDTWKGKTKNFAERRVYCPYTGITAICRFLLQQYALLHN